MSDQQLTDPTEPWRGMYCCDCLAPLTASNVYERVEDFNERGEGSLVSALICKTCAEKQA